MISSDSRILLDAIRFSANKHRNQRRKNKEASAYINHPINVAELLVRTAKVEDIEIVIAAILHDTIEDTDTTPEEIENAFGAHVLSLVLECTDDKSLPKETRKQLQIEHAPNLSTGAKQIKIADKISNLLDITHSPPVDWTLERKMAYVDWAEQVVAGLRGLNEDLESYFDEVVSAARQKLTAR
jgi:guanosine-3',5'-bis(diphosphate) 3'-pyrophosphohydrolase